MAIVYDERKSARNEAERGLPFHLVEQLDWPSARIRQDTREDYGEVRLLVTALLDQDLHVVVVTPRGRDLRVISFRKASRRERQLYDQARTSGA